MSSSIAICPSFASPHYDSLFHTCSSHMNFVMPEVENIHDVSSPTYYHPDIFTRSTAHKKAFQCHNTQGSAYIIACSSILVCRRKLWSPPANISAAQQFIKALSGRQHQCITSVCFWNIPMHKKASVTVRTYVKMKKLTPKEEKDWLDSQEWQQGLGYTIFGISGKYIRKINGSPTNLFGWPAHEIQNRISTIFPRQTDEIL